uniref:Uncharacterized protein n=1 Tax=Arundo donax TaxID=35708 RepID=A0A0A8YPI9_ARUDO
MKQCTFYSTILELYSWFTIYSKHFTGRFIVINEKEHEPAPSGHLFVPQPVHRTCNQASLGLAPI